VFRQSYSGLEEYLRGFSLACSVLQTSENLERVACELAQDNQAEGVRYIEVRFAPQLHASRDLDMQAVFSAVNRGLARAKHEFNSRTEVADGSEPPFEYGIIACAMRYFSENFSHHYSDMVSAHQYTAADRLFGLASQELVGAAAYARNEGGLPVVAVDIAGPEEGYPPIHHREAYMQAHRSFLRKTVHAGEAYGPESIFQAITELHADRIGHGTSLFDPDAIRNRDIDDRVKYIDDLVQFIADRRITIEVCLSSNLQTDPKLGALADHPFGQMMENRLSTVLCTDNRTVSNTTVTNEIYRASEAFDLGMKEIKTLMVYGFKRSFYPGRYVAKRDYVRKCMEFFERVEQEHSAGARNGV
jgi:adenosine deaminase